MKTQKYPNLTPWPPGQSGNPSGRKPGSKNMSTIVQELLDQEADSSVLAKSSIAELTEGKSMTYAKAVVLATVHKALQGNMQAIGWLADQQERGAVSQEVLRREPIVISRLMPRYESTVD
ncbi:MAG: hypothetical protein JWM00_709 [Candidatus Saccharibacteria bacterium]|nr:hypothetical protein [Candidatus Saccharibacteria bacterium]